MKVLSKNIQFESVTGDRLLVEVQSQGSVYFETWSNGYKQYKVFEGDEIGTPQILEILSDLQLVDFDPVEICNFIHYSECFYES